MVSVSRIRPSTLRERTELGTGERISGEEIMQERLRRENLQTEFLKRQEEARIQAEQGRFPGFQRQGDVYVRLGPRNVVLERITTDPSTGNVTLRETFQLFVTGMGRNKDYRTAPERTQRYENEKLVYEEKLKYQSARKGGGLKSRTVQDYKQGTRDKDSFDTGTTTADVRQGVIIGGVEGVTVNGVFVPAGQKVSREEQIAQAQVIREQTLLSSLPSAGEELTRRPTPIAVKTVADILKEQREERFFGRAAKDKFIIEQAKRRQTEAFEQQRENILEEQQTQTKEVTIRTGQNISGISGPTLQPTITPLAGTKTQTTQQFNVLSSPVEVSRLTERGTITPEVSLNITGTTQGVYTEAKKPTGLFSKLQRQAEIQEIASQRATGGGGAFGFERQLRGLSAIGLSAVATVGTTVLGTITHPIQTVKSTVSTILNPLESIQTIGVGLQTGTATTVGQIVGGVVLGAVTGKVFTSGVRQVRGVVRSNLPEPLINIQKATTEQISGEAGAVQVTEITGTARFPYGKEIGLTGQEVRQVKRLDEKTFTSLGAGEVTATREFAKPRTAVFGERGITRVSSQEGRAVSIETIGTQLTRGEKLEGRPKFQVAVGEAVDILEEQGLRTTLQRGLRASERGKVTQADVGLSAEAVKIQEGPLTRTFIETGTVTRRIKDIPAFELETAPIQKTSLDRFSISQKEVSKDLGGITSSAQVKKPTQLGIVRTGITGITETVTERGLVLQQKTQVITTEIPKPTQAGVVRASIEASKAVESERVVPLFLERGRTIPLFDYSGGAYEGVSRVSIAPSKLSTIKELPVAPIQRFEPVVIQETKPKQVVSPKFISGQIPAVGRILSQSQLPATGQIPGLAQIIAQEQIPSQAQQPLQVTPQVEVIPPLIAAPFVPPTEFVPPLPPILFFTPSLGGLPGGGRRGERPRRRREYRVTPGFAASVLGIRGAQVQTFGGGILSGQELRPLAPVTRRQSRKRPKFRQVFTANQPTANSFGGNFRNPLVAL